MPVHIGEPLIAAAVAEGEAGVVEAHFSGPEADGLIQQTANFSCRRPGVAKSRAA